MEYLSREQILDCQDLQYMDVAVPEWGGVVRVRGLTGAERDQYEESILRIRGQRADVRLENARARLVSLAVRDADGRRLFTDADVMALGRKSARALERVFDAAAKLSGLQAGDVEALAKNSQSDQSDDSGSG